MIERLKEETRVLHEEIERENLANRIMDHSINMKEYKLLLLQNFLAYRSVENAIFEYLPKMQPEKYLRLEKDLTALEVSFSECSFSSEFRCDNEAEAFGAAYVVEGSSLGGLLIAKNLKKCSRLNEVDEFYFFDGNKDHLASWKTFKNALAAKHFSEVEAQLAVDKAKETFLFFKKLFQTRFSLAEKAPAKTPKAAMIVMILIALLLPLENKYRRAM